MYQNEAFLAAFRDAAPEAADAAAVPVGRRVEAVRAADPAVSAGVGHGVDRDGAGAVDHVGVGHVGPAAGAREDVGQPVGVDGRGHLQGVYEEAQFKYNAGLQGSANPSRSGKQQQEQSSPNLRHAY